MNTTKKIRRDATTSIHKTKPTKASRTIKKGKEIVQKMFDNIIHMMNLNAESNCFITIEDHKENFLNHPKARLINPWRNELGTISKAILDSISYLKYPKPANGKTRFRSAVKWFLSLKDKHPMNSLCWISKISTQDLSQDMFNKTLNVANKYINILKCDINVIHHSRKS